MAPLKLRGHPLSQTLPTHTLGPATLRPQSLPPAVSTGLLLGFLPINSGFLANASASWLSPIIIYLGELLVFQRSALKAASHLSGSRCWHLSRSGVSMRDSGTRHILGSSTLSTLTPGASSFCVCVRHAASSSLTRDRAQAPCVGSVQS